MEWNFDIYANFSIKEKGNHEKLHFIYGLIEKNLKFWIFSFFGFFHYFPFNFGQINIDIKISFPQPHENNQEGSRYQFFQLISAKLLYSLCCGGPCII